VTPEQHRLHNARRFNRQFETLFRLIPALRGPVTRIRARGWWVVRVPVGFLFIAGGFLAILPIFGVWMIPLGLLLLAVDLPVLQGPLGRLMVRARRRAENLRRRWRPRKRP
jgi:hypothetical protein